MSQVVIRAEHVSKNFVLPHEKINSVKSIFTSITKAHRTSKEVQNALQDVSFEINKGEFFGIVGRNGSGKSTLLKILAGIYQPSEGSVRVEGKLVPFIELGVGFNPELTGRENVFLNGAMLGFSKREVSDMYDDIVHFAELERFMDQKLKNYSSGMQVRLAFSMAVRAEADVLLVDEVLAVGDADFQRKCFDYFRKLKKNQKTVVFVSHDMSAVREFCDRAVLIDKSKVIARGDGRSIANKYNKLFMEENPDEERRVKAPTEPPKAPAKGVKRWGEKQVVIDSIEFKKRTLNDSDKNLVFKVSFKAVKPYEGLVSGFSVRTGAGKPLCGTNTRIKQQFLPPLEEGEIGTIEWTCPNIFADGEHILDITLHDTDGLTIYDWWEEATTFNVKRSEKTAYEITPPIEVRLG